MTTQQPEDLTTEVTAAAMLGGCGNGPHLHTFEEAAAMLRVGLDHLKKRADAREIPFRQIGRNRLLSDADLLWIVEFGAVAPPHDSGRAHRPAPRAAAKPRQRRRSIA